MRASLDGEEVAIIVNYEETNEHGVNAEPLAILVSGDLFNRIIPPSNPIEAIKLEPSDEN
ncbi:hypothetical protein UFOVP1344_22 [uncultured Caudovirales phage]|uniref:Uncharacterized protein n=1 Tax=uncultured Caudovirales phage TaxID=2100421 RepID=A0A6J5Q7Q6_9CAUD|nr:hypothetical protein UFOVP1005_22 [uncultured Caudovirales phage]CAB4200001.1 hypothetical protein UFOVP1344_22 [uncultured Caudovirales phage]CAB4218238.1 hypothetical protein UFOVP1602_18 [uncultured Caudovirales phage]